MVKTEFSIEHIHTNIFDPFVDSFVLFVYLFVNTFHSVSIPIGPFCAVNIGMNLYYVSSIKKKIAKNVANNEEKDFAIIISLSLIYLGFGLNFWSFHDTFLKFDLETHSRCK